MNSKKTVICTYYKWLFRLLPVNAPRVWIMDRHFSRCPHCLGQAADDGAVRKLWISPTEAQNLPPVWLSIRDKLAGGEPMHAAAWKKTFVPPARRPRWRLASAAAAAAALLLSILFLSLPGDKKTPGMSARAQTAADGQVAVKSVKIGGEAARYYVFHSDNPDKLIVWAQKQ
jgi:hypothetical protein